MTWVFEDATEAFEEFRSDWDSLNRSRGDHILLDSKFMRQLIRHFGNAGMLLAINRDRSAAALLNRDNAGSWNTFQPAQSPLGAIVLSNHNDPFDGTFELLRNLPGFPMLLSITQQDPNYSAFPSTVSRTDVEILNYIETACLPVSGTFEAYWNGRGANLRHNLDRQKRRLADQGRTCELRIHRHAAQMADCVKIFGHLESQGWKGKDGTAVEEGNVQGCFYRALLEDFCEHKESVVYQFLLDGNVIASDLCLMRQGMLVVLKTTYDESLQGFSPGLLMRREIVRQVFGSGEIRVIEFYGRVRDWHTKWTDTKRTMFHVNLFRNRGVAKLREIVKKF